MAAFSPHATPWRALRLRALAVVGFLLCILALSTSSLAGAQRPGAIDEYQPPAPGLDPALSGGPSSSPAESDPGVPGAIGGDSGGSGDSGAAGSESEIAGGASDDRGEFSQSSASPDDGITAPFSDYPINDLVLWAFLLVILAIAIRLALAGYRRLRPTA